MEILTRETAGVPEPPQARILQFGGGNFLRGYFDWMVQLLNERTAFAGGVRIVKPTKGGRYDALVQQGGLFHVSLTGVKRGEVVGERRLVSCCGAKVLYPYEDYGAFLDSAAEDISFIVSNTTEAGIRFAAEPRPEARCGREFPGKLTQWLYRRWQMGGAGCHVLPLELIEANGHRLRDCVLQYAAHWKLAAGFSEWVRTDNHFYNTLVDRIVSGYPAGAETVWQALGYRDRLLVAGEYYHSLVVEAPATGIPGLPLHEAGINVTYTDDLTPYRERKVRLLNGAHTAIVPVGYLAGLDTVGEVMKDEEVGKFLEDVLYEEVIPTLDQPGAVLREYAADVLDRFRNPSIEHRLLDISLNSTTKFRTRLLPSLLTYREKFGRLPEGMVRALAALLLFYRGRRGEETIPLRDEPSRLAFFREQWSKEQSTEQLTRAALGREDWWGQDLNEVPGLTSAVARQL